MSNNIGDEVGKHLADVLRNNKVILFIFAYYSCLSSRFFEQKLSTITLMSNTVTNEAAKHLADALRNNTVNLSFVFRHS